MADLRDIAPAPNERGIIIGQTGSGKTTLAVRLMACYRHVVAIDPKQTLGSGERGGGHLEGYELARTPQELERAGRKHGRIQYRPEMEYQTPEHWERIFNYLYRRGHHLTYVDELFDTHDNNRAPRSLRRILTSGRELGIGFLGATQRPRGIDRRIMTEAEHWYVFALRDPDDLRYLRARTGEGRLPDYGFFYTHDKAPFHAPAVKRLKL